MPKKLTTDQFIERSKTIHGEKFSYERTTYVNSTTPVIITCKDHGDVTVNPNNHINNGSGCIHCCGLAKKTTEQFIAQVQSVHGDVFCFDRTTYVNDSTKVIITCRLHGDFHPTPSNILRGSGCPICATVSASNRYRKPTDQFISEAVDIHGDAYDYSHVDYVNSTTKVSILCKKHGLFEQAPTVHVHQRCGCPMCNTSRGELETKQWLDSRNVYYVTQYSFDDCVDKGKLRFDFFLPDHGILIEYNGIQHYRDVPLLRYSNDTLADIQRRDNIKTEYAKNKGLCLITIPYNTSVDKCLSHHLALVLT